MTRPVEHHDSRAQYSPRHLDAVFFVGDSNTFGWRDDDVGGWPTRLITSMTNRHTVTAYNLGVRGDTSRSILARWREEVGRRRQAAHSAIVFAFGANDAKLYPDGTPFVPLEETHRNTAAILASAKKDHDVLMIGPAPIDEAALARVLNPSGSDPVPTNRQVVKVAGILREEAARAGVPFLDIAAALAANDDWFAALRETDGIHPPGRGHDMIAALVSTWSPWVGLFDAGKGA